MAGYSGTPLSKKLGYKAGYRAAVLGGPDGYRDLLDPLPEGVTFVELSEGGLDLVHFFTKSADDLVDRFDELAGAIDPDGAVWISWPKKASKVDTDVDEALVRHTGLAGGLVDNKICAVDDVWSGLRFVVRVADRPKRRGQ